MATLDEPFNLKTVHAIGKYLYQMTMYITPNCFHVLILTLHYYNISHKETKQQLPESKPLLLVPLHLSKTNFIYTTTCTPTNFIILSTIIQQKQSNLIKLASLTLIILADHITHTSSPLPIHSSVYSPTTST